MPEKQYRNTITNLEPDVPRPEAASDNNVIHTPQAAELIERGLPELEAAELGLPELATRPEPASPPVAAKGGRGEAKTGAGAGDRERRGEGAERGTPPPRRRCRCRRCRRRRCRRCRRRSRRPPCSAALLPPPSLLLRPLWMPLPSGK